MKIPCTVLYRMQGLAFASISQILVAKYSHLLHFASFWMICTREDLFAIASQVDDIAKIQCIFAFALQDACYRE